VEPLAQTHLGFDAGRHRRHQQPLRALDRQWIKERYRTMRDYKRQESIRNVVSLTTLMGAHEGYFDMTGLVA
jgi:hypothetical protein